MKNENHKKGKEDECIKDTGKYIRVLGWKSPNNQINDKFRIHFLEIFLTIENYPFSNEDISCILLLQPFSSM
jgi:hypothetical protein